MVPLFLKKWYRIFCDLWKIDKSIGIYDCFYVKVHEECLFEKNAVNIGMDILWSDFGIICG